MKFEIEFTLEESSYINTIPGSVILTEEGSLEGKSFPFTLMEKVKPLEGENRYKIKWTYDTPPEADKLGKKIIKQYKELEAE